jgi:hypothetical protein
MRDCAFSADEAIARSAWCRAAGCTLKGNAVDEAVLCAAVKPDCRAASNDLPFVTCVD